MATKTYVVDGLGEINVTKRHSARHLRLSIDQKGQVRVSIPEWIPYRTGLEFAVSRKDWIIKKRPEVLLLEPNQQIGRAHHLIFTASDSTLTAPKARIVGNTISVCYAKSATFTHPAVQQAALKASIKALRLQAESLLPRRLKQLSETHGLAYDSISIKQLSRRWGSCDQQQRIVLNLYLVQLPWELIDYVVIHELAHTQYLNHGRLFWEKVESLLPDAKKLKKQLATYHPGIIKL